MKRQRLHLDNLDTSSRFYIHRQFISTGDGVDDDPVQLMYPDNSTTIGFRVKSVDDLDFSALARGETLPGSRATDASDSGKVIVYASLSDEARIRKSAEPYRRYCIALAAAQAISVLSPFTCQLLDKEIRDTANEHILVSLLLLLTSLLVLIALRFGKPWEFHGAGILNSVAILIAIYEGFLKHPLPWVITCRIMSVFVSACQSYMCQYLREIHLPQTFLLKQSD